MLVVFSVTNGAAKPIIVPMQKKGRHTLAWRPVPLTTNPLASEAYSETDSRKYHVRERLLRNEPRYLTSTA